MEDKTMELIKEYLKENLTISINADTSSFHHTDASTSTRVEISISLEGEIISTDSYYTK